MEGHLLGRGGRSLYSPVKGLVSALAVELNPLGESAQVFGAAKDVATLSLEKHTLPNIVGAFKFLNIFFTAFQVDSVLL